MNVFLKILLFGFLFFCAVSVMAIGMICMKLLGINEGSLNFWFILLVTVVSAMSLIGNGFDLFD